MATRRVDRKTSSTEKPRVQETNSQSLGWLNYFRFGESYSSLLLGIVVVIITTIFLVFLVKDRNVTQQSTPQKEVSSVNTKREVTPTSSKIAVNVLTPTVTPKPTLVPTKRPTQTPIPTVKKEVTKQPTVTKAAVKPPTKPTAVPSPTKAIAAKPTSGLQPVPSNGKTQVHTVAAGENLWVIAEKYYKSGYNWVDIAKANNLSDPSVITSGMKLTIPNVTPKLATVQTASPTDTSVYGPKITGSTYTVQKGDHLWGIAVRAYGDGYKWVEIARVNNITTPNVINVGLVLKLPRTSDLSKK